DRVLAGEPQVAVRDDLDARQQVRPQVAVGVLLGRLQLDLQARDGPGRLRVARAEDAAVDVLVARRVAQAARAGVGVERGLDRAVARLNRVHAPPPPARP